MNKKKIFSLALTLICLVVFCSGCDFSKKKSSVDLQSMMQIASEINKACPVFVDSDTRLDNVLALPDKKLKYNYTLVNLAKESIDTAILKTNLEPVIIKNIQVSKEMETLRDNDVIFIYSYKDMNGDPVIEIEITPDLYKGN